MRWKHYKCGDEKTKRHFALLPIKVGDVTRWLEMVTVRYRLCGNWPRGSYWRAVEFVDGDTAHKNEAVGVDHANALVDRVFDGSEAVAARADEVIEDVLENASLQKEEATSKVCILGPLNTGEAPENWDVRDTAKLLGTYKTSCGNREYRRFQYEHPDGYESQFVAELPENCRWDPFDEVNMIVRHGVGSREHKEWMAKHGDNELGNEGSERD